MAHASAGTQRFFRGQVVDGQDLKSRDDQKSHTNGRKLEFTFMRLAVFPKQDIRRKSDTVAVEMDVRSTVKGQKSSLVYEN